MRYIGTSFTAFFCALIVAISPLSAQDQGPVPLVIEADEKLEWNQEARYYLAVGNALAEQGAQTIKAGRIQAFYNSEDEGGDITHMHADGAVGITDGVQSARGDKLIYDVAAGSYILTGTDLEVISTDATATADEVLEYYAADNRLIAKGDARIALANGRVLAADDINIQTLPDGSVEAIDAMGNVEIELENGRTASSDEAVYTEQTGLALLTGNVTISEGENILNGQKAEIDFNKGISRMLATGNGRVTGVFLPGGTE